jgi:homopolymeric O-antigen transport system ATP-binding protein
MSDTIITVENLSKRYIIGHQRDSRDALRHRLEGAMRAPFKWLRSRSAEKKNAKEEFWALKDVSFEVQQGDAVGIIGRNGAGKSTLLKILSRITEPTNGRVTLRGRVASLLEVGTGFHQELTGRENIYLNGAILGMTRAEIRRKFDEIVAFAEIEQFLDTPVKRYSSGMYVRLAFAVAAHLEPEILIVDEVLAVGDAQFQKKCLGKMGQIARGGRTVLFVSHNMSAVQSLCRKALLLESGTVKAFDDVRPIVRQYLDTGLTGKSVDKPLSLGPALKLLSLEFHPSPIESGSPLRWRLEFGANGPTIFNDLALIISSAQSARVALLDLRALGFPIRLATGQVWRVEGIIESLPLVEGEYSVGLTVNTIDFWEDVFDLATVRVTSRILSHGYSPYDVIYRGTVELNFSTTNQLLHPDSPDPRTNGDECLIGTHSLAV